MNNLNQDKIHWADQIAEKLIEERGSGAKQIVATGITPSGPIHVGNMREVVTGEAIHRALRDRGVEAELIYIADTLDPLRKVYPFLEEEEYKKHVGAPLSRIPCPCGSHPSYAEHFLEPFLESLERLDIHPTVYRADVLYQQGKYLEAVKTALEQRDKIAEILEEVSGRSLPPEWQPFNTICKNCNRLAILKSFDLEKETVEYSCQHCGDTSQVSMREGKLNWRVDWPARWEIFGVTLEPFGKDHATTGGSYDTAKRITREIYGYTPPYPVVYEWIMLKGKGAMHSSKGIAVSIQEMLEVLPPEVLRYLIIRTKPEKHIEFDPGLPLLNLIDEYDRAEGGRAWQFSQTRNSRPTRIPFRHLVTAVQIADRNLDYLIEILRRSGYDTTDRETIKTRAQNAATWLERYAPPVIKFKIQEKLPAQAKNLKPPQKEALRRLATRIQTLDSQQLHQEIYNTAQQLEINPKELFEAIYLVLLGRKSGPRAGYFLKALEPGFVVRRFQEAGGS